MIRGKLAWTGGNVHLDGGRGALGRTDAPCGFAILSREGGFFGQESLTWRKCFVSLAHVTSTVSVVTRGTAPSETINCWAVGRNQAVRKSIAVWQDRTSPLPNLLSIATVIRGDLAQLLVIEGAVTYLSFYWSPISCDLAQTLQSQSDLYSMSDGY